MTEYQNPRLRVALIATDDAGRILLLEHTRPHGSYWVLPGGGVDPGEGLPDALRREIREELSADSEIFELRFIGELIQPQRHVVDFFYTGTIQDGREFTLLESEGITDVGWFTLDDISAMTVLPPEVIHAFTLVNECGNCGIIYLGVYKNR